MYYVYLTASKKHGTLYLGVTNNLVRRIHEHKSKSIPGFTSQYNVVKLVWFECYDDPTNAIAREKDIKKWRRDWKTGDRAGEPGLAGFIPVNHPLDAGTIHYFCCGVWISGSPPSAAPRNDA